MKRFAILITAGVSAFVLLRFRQTQPAPAAARTQTHEQLSPAPVSAAEKSTAAQIAQKPVERPALPRTPVSQTELWAKISPLESMAAFQKWSADYTAQPEAGKISEGVKLAQERRATMRSLIKHDPEQALANAVPEAVRRAMPAEVKALLEEKVDARGDLMVTAMSVESGRIPKGQTVERTHAVLDDGRRLRAYVYGNREFQPSREDVPIHGIVLDGAMAVNQWPGRILEPVEQADAKKSLTNEPVCPTSGIPTAETGTEVAVQAGRDVSFYCGPAHARQVLTEAGGAEAVRPPGIGVRTNPVVNAASGGAGQSVPNFLAEGDASWTTGSKRLGIVRLTYNGIHHQNLSVQDCEDIISGMGAAFNDWSYGKCKLRSVSSTGSFITPEFDLGSYSSYYEEDDVDTIWMLAELWAMAHGRPPGSYDWLMVISGDDDMKDEDGKGVWWGGLGNVGGPHTFMRTKTVDGTISVGLHELGHNLGLRHSSNIWPAPVLKEIENGIPVFEFGEEYGDRYDKMGRGKQDFNVRYKDWLQWLDDANVPLAATDGRYILREHDLEERSGVRGLQVPFNIGFTILGTEDSLFVEYRLNDITDPLQAFGSEIHLGSPSKPKTYLLDCTPETPNDEPDDANGDPDISGNLDAVLLPGRTFAYTKYGMTVYITNIAADPASGELEVEINHGTPAGNDAPTGNITTNTPAGAVGQKIYFTANASDADGDELAYHWQIAGLGPHDNTNIIQATFTSTGTKTVKCIVSDKHGGVVTLTKNFSIASNSPPSISAISDKITDEDVPLLNIPFTVSDPTTPAGSLTVSAVSSNTSLFPAGNIVLGGSGGSRTISLTPPANRHGEAVITVTVSDGGLQDTEDFKVTVNGVTPGTTLISSGSTWRYRDASSAPPNNWNSPAYSDSAWALDNARFVYPAPALNLFGWTVLSAPAGSRTCYFRKSFTMPAAPTGVPTIKFLCDDGLVIYNGGVEIWRHNMPAGPVGYTTKASSSVEGVKQTQWITVPLNLAQFQAGASNTIAIEVHDAGGTRGGGDTAFDFQLQLLQAPTVSNITDKSSPEDTLAGGYNFSSSDSEAPPANLTYTAVSSNQALVLDSSIKFGFNIITGRYVTAMPQPNATGITEITVKVSDGGSETWEKFNLTVTPVNDAPTLMPLPDMAVAMNELAPLVEVQIGDVDNDPTGLTVTATSSNGALLPQSGIQVLPGTAPNRRWLRLTPNSGIGAQTNVTVNVSDGSLNTSDVFIFRVSATFSPTTTDVKLVQSGETWRYWAAALPSSGHGGTIDFTDPALDDRGWPDGPSQLGYGNDGEATVVPSAPYRVTTYFRKKFTVPTPSALSQLKLRMLRDDGAIVYINGTQVWMSNMPRVAILPTTLADDDISGTAEDTWQSLTIGTAALVVGSNTIAVELHQSVMPAGLTPGDLTFDFEMDGVPAAPSNTDVLIAPGEMWAYWDQSAYPDATWKLSTYGEDGWKYGLARLGYGIGGESTTVNKDNDNGTQRNPAVLFRKVFDIADPPAYAAVHLYVQRDDGIAVHLNGIRVHTEHMPASFSLADLATTEAPAGEQTQWRHYLIDPARLTAGRNLLAVEVHQFSLTGTDLNFDLQLIGDLKGTPTLYLTPSGANMELAWPAGYSGWILKGSTDLNAWTTVPEYPLLDAGWIYVLTPASPAHRFFKLEKP